MKPKKTYLVNTHEAKSQLSRLLRAVVDGAVVRICRNGVPIAELSSIEPAKRPQESRALLSKIEFLEDPSLPIDEKDWPKELR